MYLFPILPVDMGYEIKDGRLISVKKREKIVKIPFGVREISYSAFNSNCTVERVIFPESVEVIAEGAFFGCENLKAIELPESIKKIGELAFAMSGLESVCLPAGIEEIEKGAFSCCEQLERVLFKGEDCKLGERCFCGCDALFEIKLPPRITEIPPGAFELCNSLEQVEIPSGIVRRHAFAFNMKLSRAIIRAGAQLEDDAFAVSGPIYRGVELVYI